VLFRKVYIKNVYLIPLGLKGVIDITCIDKCKVGLLLVAFILILPLGFSADCQITESCTDTCAFSIFPLTDSHVGTCDYYSTKVCCDELYDATLRPFVCEGNEGILLRQFEIDDSHVEAPDGSLYSEVLCSKACNCTLKPSCEGEEFCMVSMSDSTDAHVGSCGYYDEDLCCECLSPPGVTLISPEDESAGHPEEVGLNVNLTDSLGGELNITFYNGSTLMWKRYNIPNGTNASFPLIGLSRNDTYSWHVEVNGSGGVSTTSDEWKFNTTSLPKFCTIKETCSEAETCVFSVPQENDTHIGQCGYFGLNYCCEDIQMARFDEEGCSEREGAILKAYQLDNTHVEAPELTNYPISICAWNCSCSIKDHCNADEECVASIYDFTNSHVGECGYFDNQICCKCGNSIFGNADLNEPIPENNAVSVSSNPELSIKVNTSLEIDSDVEFYLSREYDFNNPGQKMFRNIGALPSVLHPAGETLVTDTTNITISDGNYIDIINLTNHVYDHFIFNITEDANEIGALRFDWQGTGAGRSIEVYIWNYDFLTWDFLNISENTNVELNLSSDIGENISQYVRWNEIHFLVYDPVTWWDTSWSDRINLTFSNWDQTNLAEFPLLVKLDSGKIDYSKCKSDGSDLRFIDNYGNTVLNYHIESWDPLGESYIWVNVPIIENSGEDFIFLYYNNPSAPDVQNEVGTYDGDYEGVWHLNERLDNNVIDPSTWTVSTGSAIGFTRNGDETENYRILSNDPFGEETVIWEARPTAVSGADGGWNGAIFNIDNTKTYRFSTWVKRDVQGSTGRFYLGTKGFNSAEEAIGVIDRGTGATNTNPYFWYSSSPPNTELPTGTWVLVVGHIWPAGSGTGSVHTDSGRYNTAGSKFGTIHRDYVWSTNNVKSRHRSYLYYSTDASTRQQWAYPRVDIIDGTEPSIADLISDAPSDVIDSSGNVYEGKVVGADITTDSPLGNALAFDGVDDYVELPSVNPTTAITVEAWIKSAVGTGYGGVWQLVSKYSSYILGTSGTGTNNVCFLIHNGDSWQYGSCYDIPNPENWHHFVGTYDSIAQEKKLYVDGKLRETTYPSGTIAADTGPIDLGQRECCPGSVFGGIIDEVRISDTARSAEWVNASYLSQADIFLDYGVSEAGSCGNDFLVCPIGQRCNVNQCELCPSDACDAETCGPLEWGDFNELGYCELSCLGPDQSQDSCTTCNTRNWATNNECCDPGEDFCNNGADSCVLGVYSIDHCLDGKQNCDEIQIDIGGNDCPQLNGGACTLNEGCVSEHCSNGICCASGDCCAIDTDCPIGTSCNVTSQCESCPADTCSIGDCTEEQWGDFNELSNCEITCHNPDEHQSACETCNTSIWSTVSSECCGDLVNDDFCNLGADSCINGFYFTNHCTDNQKNCDEEWFDCGGADCPACNYPPLPPEPLLVQNNTIVDTSIATLNFTLTDPEGDNIIEYTIIIDDDPDFTDPLIVEEVVTQTIPSGTEIEYASPILAPNTVYYWSVSASDGGTFYGDPVDSTWTFETPAAFKVATNYVSLKVIKKGIDTDVENGTRASALFTDLTGNTEYSWYARGVDIFSNIGLSSNFTFTTSALPYVTHALLDGNVDIEGTHDLNLEFGGNDSAYGDLTKVVDWRVNSNSIALLNLAFQINHTPSNITRDYSSNLHHANVFNVKWTRFGLLGGAYIFDGSSNLILPNNSLFDISKTLTLETWIKTDTIPTSAEQGYLIGHTNFDTDWYGYALAISPTTGRVYLGTYNGSGTGTQAISTTNIADGEWHHIIGTHDRGTSKIYVDGILENTIVGADMPEYTISIPLKIAACSHSPGNFTGMLDEVKIYNRVIPPNEVYKLYNNTINSKEDLVLNLNFKDNLNSLEVGAIPDYSSFENNGTLGVIETAPIWVPDGQIGASYHFDGENDFITVADEDSLDLEEFTLVIWAKGDSS